MPINNPSTLSQNIPQLIFLLLVSDFEYYNTNSKVLAAPAPAPAAQLPVDIHFHTFRQTNSISGTSVDSL
jgi:hypothetical protein